MPEAGHGTGQAHNAATEMFRRATDKSSKFSHYTEGVAAALAKGAGTIAAARTALLNHADEVDRGELSVNDMWVVLIKPARVSAEKAAQLQAQAKAEQAGDQPVAVAVGEADNTTAAQGPGCRKEFRLRAAGPDGSRHLFPGHGPGPARRRGSQPLT